MLSINFDKIVFNEGKNELGIESLSNSLKGY